MDGSTFDSDEDDSWLGAIPDTPGTQVAAPTSLSRCHLTGTSSSQASNSSKDETLQEQKHAAHIEHVVGNAIVKTETKKLFKSLTNNSTASEEEAANVAVPGATAAMPQPSTSHHTNSQGARPKKFKFFPRYNPNDNRNVSHGASASISAAPSKGKKKVLTKKRVARIFKAVMESDTDSDNDEQEVRVSPPYFDSIVDRKRQRTSNDMSVGRSSSTFKTSSANRTSNNRTSRSIRNSRSQLFHGSTSQSSHANKNHLGFTSNSQPTNGSNIRQSAKANRQSAHTISQSASQPTHAATSQSMHADLQSAHSTSTQHLNEAITRLSTLATTSCPTMQECLTAPSVSTSSNKGNVYPCENSTHQPSNGTASSRISTLQSSNASRPVSISSEDDTGLDVESLPRMELTRQIDRSPDYPRMKCSPVLGRSRDPPLREDPPIHRTRFHRSPVDFNNHSSSNGQMLLPPISNSSSDEDYVDQRSNTHNRHHAISSHSAPSEPDSASSNDGSLFAHAGSPIIRSTTAENPIAINSDDEDDLLFVTPTRAIARRVANQAEKDEAYARQLQEQLDKEYAESLQRNHNNPPPSRNTVDTSSPRTRHHHSSRCSCCGGAADSLSSSSTTSSDSSSPELRVDHPSSPSHLHNHRHAAGAEYNLSQYEWDVHLALAGDEDLPTQPHEDTRELHEIVNPDLLHHLNSMTRDDRMRFYREANRIGRRTNATMSRSTGRRRRGLVTEPPTSPGVHREAGRSPARRRRTRSGRNHTSNDATIEPVRLGGGALPPRSPHHVRTLFFSPVSAITQMGSVPVINYHTDLVFGDLIAPRRGAGGRHRNIHEHFHPHHHFMLPNLPGVDEEGNNGDDYEELLRLDERAVRRGLNRDQISRLPTRVFGSKAKKRKSTSRSKKQKGSDSTPNTSQDTPDAAAIPSTSGAEQAAFTQKECHICMCEFENGDKLRILTCFHEFHTKCIDKWIKSNPTCPVCRVQVQI